MRNNQRMDAVGRYPWKASAVLLGLSLLYLTFVHHFIGLKIEHIGLVSLYNLGFIATPTTRKLVSALTAFLIFGMLYDSMKAYPNHLVNHVDIEGLYNLEMRLFGFHADSVLVTPNEYFGKYNTPLLDLITGLFYINWMSVPLMFALYLYASDKRRILDYAIVFLFVNILGFIFYYIHPAAPPWYVEEYGFVFRDGVYGSAAGLVRFDAIIGIDIFQYIYTRNSNVFAALPSLHSAYPVVVVYYAWAAVRTLWMKVFFAVFMLGIWFTAVYSGHHYVMDVLLGAALAVLGICIYTLLIARIPVIRSAMARYERWIT